MGQRRRDLTSTFLGVSGFPVRDAAIGDLLFGSRTDKVMIGSAYRQVHEYMRQYFGIGTGEMYNLASEPSRSRVVPAVMAVPYARCKIGRAITRLRQGVAQRDRTSLQKAYHCWCW